MVNCGSMLRQKLHAIKKLREVCMVCFAISMVQITCTSNRFHSKIENSDRGNKIEQQISTDFPTKYATSEEILLKKSSNKRRKSHKNSIERSRQLERKALKEKFGGELGSCLAKHESRLVREQIREHEFPEFSTPINTIKETKRAQTEALLKSFGGGLDTSLLRHESLLERDKRLANEQEYPQTPETPPSAVRRLQSDLSLMDKFGGGLGSILKKHECGLERDVRLAREAAAANPEPSESSGFQEYSSSFYSDSDDRNSDYSPPPARAPNRRASSISPLLAAEERAMDSAEEQEVDFESGAESYSGRAGRLGEEDEDAQHGQEPAVSEEEEHAAAADDGAWCAPRE
jgi:hypothetical protein